MNIFDLLKKDHKKVTGIFARLEDTTNRAIKSREKLIAQLKEELTVHTEVEERIFYPALERSEETRDLIKAARLEHQKAKELLEHLESMQKDNREFMNIVTQLKKDVKRHIKEEEGEIFSKAKDVLQEEQVEQLGTQAEEEKEEILAFHE